MENRVSIFLVDDNVGFTDKIREFLSSEFDIVGIAHNGNSALDATKSLRPEIVLLDIEMPGLSGIEVARLIRSNNPSTKIVFLTMHIDGDYVSSAFQSGAQGYVLKSRMNGDLKLALQEVMAGRTFVSPWGANARKHGV